jgi:tyrosyl-tRNA synthetase
MASGGSGDGSGLERLLAGSVDALPAGRLAEQLESGRELRVKFGMDPTSADIHLGHCVVLQKLRTFQDLGHTVVLIVGDYTGRVGDPSGRDEGRPVLSAEQIAENARTYQDQAFKVLDRERTEIRHNSEWLEMPSAELFELVRRFTVARLLERDDFQRRMEQNQGISVLELLYPVLQGYDSVAVEADVELGGSDQRFNLLFGRDVQESFDQGPQSILTMPLLVGTDGVRKMSKTYGNYVGVTDEPEEMFGRLMSIPDDVMGDYYLLLLGRELDPAAHPNDAKRALARELVGRFHDSAAAGGAEARFDAIHKRGEVPDEMPTVALADGETVHLPALLASSFDISNSEARRLLGQGGVRLDGEVIAGDVLDLPGSELSGKVLQLGKRRFVRIA